MLGRKEKRTKKRKTLFRVDFIMCLAKLFKHNNKKCTIQVPTFFFSFSKRNKADHHGMALPFMTANIQQKSSFA
jgi:hypothetical protein